MTLSYQDTYGDVPNIPKGLQKDKPLDSDGTVKSGECKKVRHSIKEFLSNLINNK